MNRAQTTRMECAGNSGPSSDASHNKLCLSLKNTKLSPSKHFISVSEEESLLVAKGVVPLNTKVTNEWPCGTFAVGWKCTTITV